jgi:hypothetical protein
MTKNKTGFLMKKTLITLLLLSNISAYASSWSGYQILNNEMKTTPGSNFRVQEISPDSLPAQKKTMKMIGGTLVSVNIPSQIARVGQPGQIEGYHSISIHNTLGRNQIYRITVNCDESRNSFSRMVAVNNGATYATSFKTYSVVQKSSPGQYKIVGYTQLDGDKSIKQGDVGTLHVTN